MGRQVIKIEPIKIIEKYYKKGSQSYHFLVEHSENVMRKALQVAKRVKHLKPDLEFIEEATMLHDIGIFLTDAPDIGCYGKHHYICHGYLGREILEKEGLPEHGLVCERHLGAGITKEEIINKKLPLPRRNMVPISLEEKIICFSDKFFSKTKEHLTEPRTVDEVKQLLTRFGQDKVDTFKQWLALFSS